MYGYSTYGAASYGVAPASQAVTPPNPSTVTGVTVTPNTATVQGGATLQLTAVVSGTNSPSQAVTWSAPGAAINLSGLFTAPAATSIVQTINGTATSQQDVNYSGTFAITVPAASVNPPDPQPDPAGAPNIYCSTIMRQSTINLTSALGPSAINLIVRLP